MLTEIYQRISAHKSFDHTKEIAKHQTLRLMEIHPNSLEKVVYLDTLLVQHKKLNRWLQPDGHTDGNGNLFEVALHETSEGTGLVLFIFMPVTNLIFDIDVQKIPERVA